MAHIGGLLDIILDPQRNILGTGYYLQGVVFVFSLRTSRWQRGLETSLKVLPRHSARYLGGALFIKMIDHDSAVSKQWRDYYGIQELTTFHR